MLTMRNLLYHEHFNKNRISDEHTLVYPLKYNLYIIQLILRCNCLGHKLIS